MENDNLELVFDGYEIDKISLSKSKDISNSKKGIGFIFKIAPDKETGFKKVNIIEGVLIEPSEEFGYKLEVIIRGKFKISNCKNDKEKFKYLLPNASAILFPYLRSVVSMVSSQLEYENITLPVMNFYTIFEDQNSEDLFLDHTHFEEF